MPRRALPTAASQGPYVPPEGVLFVIGGNERELQGQAHVLAGKCERCGQATRSGGLEASQPGRSPLVRMQTAAKKKRMVKSSYHPSNTRKNIKKNEK
jgi:hypothetical protein